jgi:hypothetical protein
MFKESPAAVVSSSRRRSYALLVFWLGNVFGFETLFNSYNNESSHVRLYSSYGIAPSDHVGIRLPIRHPKDMCKNDCF